MSIPVVASQAAYNEAIKQLRAQKEVICLNKSVHVFYLLVAREILLQGRDVKAKIVKGYEDTPCISTSISS